MTNYNYVIIGGGIAGGKACQGIRQVDESGSVALITQEPHLPYERPPLSKKYLREEAGLEKVYLKDSQFYEEQRIEVLQNTKVAKLLPAERSILLNDGRKVQYGKLLLATGCRARSLPIPGVEAENVLTLRTIEDANRIRDDIRSRGGPVLVIGGSFIGAEVSASLRQMGAEVAEVFPASHLLAQIVPEQVGHYLHAIYKKHGVQIIPETVCEKLERDGALLRAMLSNGDTFDAEIVVMGVGVQLNTELAQEAGLDLRDEDGAIEVDETLRTSDAHIYAAGDIAAWPDPTFAQRLRVEHWDVARRQGLQTGRNMAGAQETYSALPYFFSDLFELSFEVWGNLANWDQTVMRGTLQSGSFAIYYFNRGRLTGVLAIDRPDEERMPMQTLVKSRTEYDKILSKLQDENVDLKELTEEEVRVA